MPFTLQTAGRRVKLIKIWDWLILVTHILDTSVVFHVSLSQNAQPSKIASRAKRTEIWDSGGGALTRKKWWFLWPCLVVPRVILGSLGTLIPQYLQCNLYKTTGRREKWIGFRTLDTSTAYGGIIDLLVVNIVLGSLGALVSTLVWWNICEMCSFAAPTSFNKHSLKVQGPCFEVFIISVNTIRK